LKQATAEELKVDFVADTAFDGARYLESAQTFTADEKNSQQRRKAR